MLRCQSNEKKTFSATLAVSSRAMEAALSQRRLEMDHEWDSIDEGWQTLRERMTEVGITKPLESKEGIVKLNVGGLLLAFRRSVLDSEGKQQPPTWALGNLFEAEWDKRVPRDSDGHIVLDESPTCVKQLVHRLLTASSSSKATVGRAGDFARNEDPALLHYTAGVLGLSGCLAPVGMSIQGGTTIFEPHETSKLTAVVQDWCPGHPGGLELLYRASRDGWNGATFNARCKGDSPSTVTLLRVKGCETGGTDSIIGGFSSVPWSPAIQNYSYGYYLRGSPGAFVFILKDEGKGSSTFPPMKWGVKNGLAAKAVNQGCGPCFGECDLKVNWNGNMSTVGTDNSTYDVPAGSHFLQLNGRHLLDIEAFRVCSKPTHTLPLAKQEHRAGEGTNTPTAPVRTSDDVPTFGQLIADSLMEAEMVLQDAGIELALAKARTTACATALAAVYGPDVASGQQEDVVELSVRGTAMTTLRSTLRVCPDSALAARFDEGKWPAAKKDLDSDGRRMIDCRPAVFSKVLDVLRIAKRAAWAGGENLQGMKETRVTIKPGDRVAFEEFVDMYFKGCESFIMAHVCLPGDEADTC
ncbi:unnamed protein product [Ectocarpus sp. CCAP 1310/34]|nr:unnamed protein product [Ectocarpus sp. CCAP 1310/34]